MNDNTNNLDNTNNPNNNDKLLTPDQETGSINQIDLFKPSLTDNYDNNTINAIEIIATPPKDTKEALYRGTTARNDVGTLTRLYAQNEIDANGSVEILTLIGVKAVMETGSDGRILKSIERIATHTSYANSYGIEENKSSKSFTERLRNYDKKTSN
tara:strand:- start:742 stop:1209 length:468 start_codon:yes stop_codon:yes gene_type:complete